MRNLKKFFLATILLLSINTLSVYSADTLYFIDFKFILNESNAGKKAQTFIKEKLEKGFASIKKTELEISSEEKKIIQQKKLISSEEYKKKVTELRKKVSELQKKRSILLESVAKQRTFARNELLKNLNPIIKEYMNQKKIRMVLDKKSLLLADENLDITKDIMKVLNKNLKSIKLN